MADRNPSVRITGPAAWHRTFWRAVARSRQVLRAAFGFLLVPVVVTLGLAAVTHPAAAQFSSSYVTPFPPDGRYRVMVIGDSLAEGLTGGLRGELEKDGGIQLLGKTAWGVGLTAGGALDALSVTRKAVADSDFQIAIVLFGVSDWRQIRVDGKRLKPGSDEWIAAYTTRVDAMLERLATEKAAVYWVGLPIVRGRERVEIASTLNLIFRERAARRGLRYIDTWAASADQEGGYTDYGPDMEGRVRRLRDKDGIHFTASGYGTLAHFVAKSIQRDIATARTQQDVPLAGDEEEQQRISERRRPNFSATPEAVGQRLTEGPISQRLPLGELIEYKDDTSKVVLTITPDLGAAIASGDITASRRELEIELPRPAIPTAVVQHIRRRSGAAAPAASGPLEFNLATGATLIGQITPEEEWTQTRGRRVPITQTPYYKVLVKGERLPSKPGRADDFSWPPPSGSSTVARQPSG